MPKQNFVPTSGDYIKMALSRIFGKFFPKKKKPIILRSTDGKI